ncbi:MAG: sensor histidine kinase [Bacteroidota bacterium]
MIKKYGLFGLSFLFLAGFCFYYQTNFRQDHQKGVHSFQQRFIQKEKDLNTYVQAQKELLRQKGVAALCHGVFGVDGQEFYLHVYRNDSLIFWNSNKLPVFRFADLHYPSDGLVKLQNGWYYAKSLRRGKVTAVAAFRIKKEFAMENEYLRNDYGPGLEMPFPATVVLEKENAFPVHNQAGRFLFALYPLEQQQASDHVSNILVFLLLGGLSSFLLGLYHITKKLSGFKQLLLAFGLAVIQHFCIRFDLYSWMGQTTFYDPTLYASSNWFPNFLILILNCVFIFFFFRVLSRTLKSLEPSTWNKTFAVLMYLFSLVFAYFIAYLYESLVKDSSIPLEIEKLFKLNFYSFWATLCMGVLFFAYFMFVRATMRALLNNGLKKSVVIILWLSTGILYSLYEVLYCGEHLFSAFWPLIINGIILLNLLRSNGQFSFNYGVILLFLFAAYIANNINEFQSNKEMQERELFAQQLASDQDISTELEYKELSKKLETEKYFEKLLQNPRKLGVSELKDFMERKYYTNFWERYETDFYLFDEKNEPVINYTSRQSTSREYLENILQKHSKLSEIDSHFFFIKDYTSQLSYIGKQLFFGDSGRSLQLYTTLKSKRIPEKIGFPRLLVSDQANVFKAVENYSIAKYYNGKLVGQSGKFSYPTRDFALTRNSKRASGYFSTEEYNHYLFRKNARDLIVLSKKIPSNFQLFTSFSYLFCFFGFFLLIPVLFRNINNFGGWTLALKIQLVLVSIVVVSLLFFGLGSGKFISNQHSEYSNDLIREKIKSVLVEVSLRFAREKELSIEQNGDYIQTLLKRVSGVFVTDINMYDSKGYILGSSRPKIFNLGLMSEQINPEALHNLKDDKKSEYTHQENIGNLNFLSAYVPLYNRDGQFLAYINLQHFGQQQGFENQIESFLVAIINVFILLLAFSIILSILVSNWVTSPLKVIQQSFAKVQLGKYNEPIAYDSKDEIGALVRNYNQKLEELAFTAQQLAQSERESAWREMAKQVAHEIKNPLTPMKLSLQHLQRIFDPDDPNSKLKLDKVISSIIEQIDGLTVIANEFSNFAKMPKENKEKLDILPIIENTVLVFNQENEVDIRLETTCEQVIVLADKDLIIRVFNNLIKNAIQAIPENRRGTIVIRISEKEGNYLLAVQDNGKGIPEEQISKIFVPNFTTKSTGTGLGLAMVKQIVELHEGRIWFETVMNKHTVFFVELPKFKS